MAGRKRLARVAGRLRERCIDEFRQNYFRIDPEDYTFPVNQQDYEYTWYWFQGVRDLYYRAAEANRYILFSASQ